jgi:hypothetical protein
VFGRGLFNEGLLLLLLLLFLLGVCARCGEGLMGVEERGGGWGWGSGCKGSPCVFVH